MPSKYSTRITYFTLFEQHVVEWYIQKPHNTYTVQISDIFYKCVRFLHYFPYAYIYRPATTHRVSISGAAQQG